MPAERTKMGEDVKGSSNMGMVNLWSAFTGSITDGTIWNDMERYGTMQFLVSDYEVLRTHLAQLEHALTT